VSRALRALPALLLLAGCAATRPAPSAVELGPSRPAPAARMVAYADELAQRGEAREALLTYERVVRDYPADPATPGALYGLGRVQASATSPVRNYRAAQAAFTRLLVEHPGSRWDADARAWKVVLGDLLARDEETARLRSQLELLRRTDLELELATGAPAPAARAQDDQRIAAAWTRRLLMTSRTPFTSRAICSARVRISGLGTVPFRATTPWLVSTSIRVTVLIFSAASFAFTFVVIPASSMFSPSVRPVVD
jgi:hypothetical protein